MEPEKIKECVRKKTETDWHDKQQKACGGGTLRSGGSQESVGLRA